MLKFLQNKKKKMVLELSVEDSHFAFASSINTALLHAEQEYDAIHGRIEESLETVRRLTPECDNLDYLLSASCGALCAVLGIFLVGKPGESPAGKITDQWFAERTKDFAKLCGWKDNGKGLSYAIAHLEKSFKVPYDQRGAGDAASFLFDLNPANHHFKSLAHNPTLLGLFFSVLDQFCTPNQSHFVTGGELIALQDADSSFVLRGKDVPSKVLCAFANWFGHLVSDMSGSSGSRGRGMGIPSPFWSWTNDIIAIKRICNIPVSEFDKSFNELALRIYKEGYDARFQAAQAIPVFINTLLVRLVYSVRRMIKYYGNTERGNRAFPLMWKECGAFSNATVKRMLAVSHGTFCLINMSGALICGFAAGGGAFPAADFAMRLNIIGAGCFVLSLYGEADRSIKRSDARESVYFLTREKTIVEDYIAGLTYLSDIYDDKYLLAFVEDLQKSDMYQLAFAKSLELAEKRNVPKGQILRSKADIDAYFTGGR